MALAHAYCVALVGVDGHLVEVEADLAQGLPGLTLIGLPDAALHEARDRVRAAVVNSGCRWPAQRITLGLSPAALPKAGSAFDLAIAAAVLGASGALPARALAGRVLLGELALDGRVRPVRGVLPAVLAAARAGLTHAVVPSANAAEAALVPGVEVEAVASLRGLLALLRGEPLPEDEADPAADAVRTDHPEPGPSPAPPEQPDLAQVGGQLLARWAVEVAAAGGHHLLLVGPPGGGKTMLAERLPGLLPPLTREEALEVTAVHSVAGVLPPGSPLVTRPPFRSPHHGATVAALVGGGSGQLRPGLVSQAHRGVLFLDEAPEFSGAALDSLRQPLESGVVDIARARASARFPARFILVMAANPCPCSRAGRGDADCTCPSPVRRRYLEKMSGPLLDRVDLQVRTQPVTRAELLEDQQHIEPSAVVALRVAQARARAAARLAGTPWRLGAEVPGPQLRARWPLPRAALSSAAGAFETGLVSARGLDRLLRIAWTLADLAGRDVPGPDQVQQALLLRGVAA